MSPFTDSSCRPSPIPHVGLHRRPTSALLRRPSCQSSLTRHIRLYRPPKFVFTDASRRFFTASPRPIFTAASRPIFTAAPRPIFTAAPRPIFITAPRRHHSLPNAHSSAYRLPRDRFIFFCAKVCHMSCRCALYSLYLSKRPFHQTSMSLLILPLLPSPQRRSIAQSLLPPGRALTAARW